MENQNNSGYTPIIKTIKRIIVPSVIVATMISCTPENSIALIEDVVTEPQDPDTSLESLCITRDIYIVPKNPNTCASVIGILDTSCSMDNDYPKPCDFFSTLVSNTFPPSIDVTSIMIPGSPEVTENYTIDPVNSNGQ